MTTSPEIEQIIRLALERLARAGDWISSSDQTADAPASELVIQDRVVTLSVIERQLAGQQRVRVGGRAIVTPAVLDLLRSQKVALVRGHTADAARTRAPLLVCGSAPWFASLPRHLCAQQAQVHSCHEDESPKLIAEHLASGGRLAIWISARPFAASVSLTSASLTSASLTSANCCRAIMLPSLRELDDAISQANPQTLIIDAPRWTVAAVGNLVRYLSQNR